MSDNLDSPEETQSDAGVISLAGRVNDGVGRLLGYSVREGQWQAKVEISSSAAQIIGFEVIGSGKERFTVSNSNSFSEI